MAQDDAVARIESLLALLLELYRAAQETPVEEFPHLALEMVRATHLDAGPHDGGPRGCASGLSGSDGPGTPGSSGSAGRLADHVANAIRINRAIRLDRFDPLS